MSENPNVNQVIILRFHGLTLDPQEAERFFELHEDTIRGPLVFMGSPQEDADRGAVHETYRDHLRCLGLLRATYKKPKKGELPEWDLKTGMIKAGNGRITPRPRLSRLADALWLTCPIGDKVLGA